MINGYWTYLVACLSWGLTTGLMLYVKLRKKSEAFPVLILVAIFLLYMNAGDLFKSYRIYAIACSIRQALSLQFLTAMIAAFSLNSFTNIVVTILLLVAVIARVPLDLGKTGIPLVGPFLVSWKKPTLIFLGLASQGFGFFTGTVLSIAMIPDTPSQPVPFNALPTDPSQYRIVSAFAIGLIASTLITPPSWKGKIQTMFASGLIASFSRVVPLYSTPVIVVPLVVVLSSLFPCCVTSISAFVPLLVQVQASGRSKLRMLSSGLFWHAAGALLAGHLSDTLACDFFILPYVSTKAIAQEFFFACIVSFVAVKKPNMALLVTTSAFLSTAGMDLPHVSSSISLGADGLSNGRLAARLIWQTMGALIGSTLLTKFADSSKIDFDQITSVTRTTDGKIISNRVTGI